MFRLEPSVQSRLSPEACLVADSFLRALPPRVRADIRSIRLYGAQARRFDPEARFDLLVVAERQNVELRTAVAIGVSAVEADGLFSATATIVTPEDVAHPRPALTRLLRNAQREGIDLWAAPSLARTA
jgi:hypothetical protein